MKVILDLSKCNEPPYGYWWFDNNLKGDAYVIWNNLAKEFGADKVYKYLDLCYGDLNYGIPIEALSAYLCNFHNKIADYLRKEK